MKRIHAFEFNDLSWLKGLREPFFDCLNMSHRVLGPYRPMPRLLAEAVEGTGGANTQILDLCSGGAEHVRVLIEYARRQNVRLPKITMTDLYPQPAFYEALKEELGSDRVDFAREPVSALQIGPELAKNKITMLCSALHHFRPNEARALIDHALRTAGGIVVLELTARNPRAMFMMAMGTFSALFAPFFARKFGLFKFIFTTLIPVVPLLFGFDGVVSCMRTYTEPELMSMIPEDLRPRVRARFQRFAYAPGLESYCFSLVLKS